MAFCAGQEIIALCHEQQSIKLIGKPGEGVSAAHDAENSGIGNLPRRGPAHDSELHNSINEMQEETNVRSLRVDIEAMFDEIKQLGFRVTVANPSSFLGSQAEGGRQQIKKGPALCVRDINDKIAGGFCCAVALGNELF